MNELVGQERLRVEIGPQQLALAVAEDDLDELTLAMRAASSMWGGRRFPILPVDEQGGINGHELLLDIANATGLIDFSGRLLTLGRLQVNNRDVPITPARALDDARLWRPSAIVSYTLEDAAALRLAEAASENPLEVAAVGRLACRDEREEWADVGAEVSDATNGTLAGIQLRRSGVIDATLNGLVTNWAAGPVSASLVFVYVAPDEPSFDDLVWFWNARAIRPGEEGADLLVHPDQLVTEAAAVREHVATYARSAPSIALVSLSVPPDRLRELLAAIDIPEHQDTKWTERLFGGPVANPTGAINADFRPGWAGGRRVGAAAEVLTTLYRPSTTVVAPCPLPFAPRFTGAHPVDLRLWADTLAGPRRPGVAALYHPQATWGATGELRLISGLYPKYEVHLQLPGPEAILVAAAALPYSPSDKARQLRAVLAREGDALDLYQDRVVIAVIEALTPSDSRQLARVISAVEPADQDYIRAAASALRERLRTLTELATSLGPIAAGSTVGKVGAALNQLVIRGHVDRGLRADCSLCDTRELRQLREAPPVPTCNACGASASYARGERGEPEMFYRLSPVMRLISASGGLPVLAAAAVLIRDGAYILPGAVATSTGKGREVDLLGWRGTEVFAGEVKRQAAGFTQIERDIRASVDLGADVHVAATIDSVDENLRSVMAAEARAAGLRLQVFDGSELLVST